MTNEELIQKYRQTGRQEYRDRLVIENIGLIFHAYRKFNWLNLSKDEIISNGSVAILPAIDGFDATKGWPFSTYACSCIRRVFQEIATQRQFPASYGKSNVPFRSLVAIPRKTQELVNQGVASEDAFESACSQYGVKAETVFKIWEMADAPSPSEVFDWHIISNDVHSEAPKVASILDECMREALSEREIAIVRMRYFEDKTFLETGLSFGVSGERIRQICGDALPKLARSLKRRNLSFDDFQID